MLLAYRWRSGACAVPVPALRDSAVGKSLERLCTGGEIICVIDCSGRGLKSERLRMPEAGIRSRSAFYRY
ncbi:hypothetical protein HEK131_18900 [Streptomyces seoulensis]|nr:hypothetical protein HEK131_18900 [Streptomyces seoulensis]